MRVTRTKADLRAALRELGSPDRIVGLVPTMGYLHAGHVSLLEASVERCDISVMSLFVNPTQFGVGEDLENYPRDEARDLAVAEETGVDLVYTPELEEVYPEGFCTYVEVEGITDVLCGAQSSRGRDHFRGVTTVVTKLLNTVKPDLAFFGRKDAQQVIVVERMCRDLDLDVQLVAMPTVREADGLAMSSRNAYLEAADRDRATAISRALSGVERAAAEGTSLKESIQLAYATLAEAGIEPEYLEARDGERLSPSTGFNGRPVLVAVAAPVGSTRLIDNVLIEPQPQTKEV